MSEVVSCRTDLFVTCSLFIIADPANLVSEASKKGHLFTGTCKEGFGHT